MSTFFTIYITLWLGACLIAAVLLARGTERYAICRRRYWQFLLRPWKVVTFACAAGAMTVMAPYTGDPTWDYVDAGFMSALTFATAPWVVGVVYLAVKRMARFSELYVAGCLWMFSASWSYDGYLVLRDGAYPATWFANIFASSVLYVSAGMFWNLDWKPGRGVIFGFMDAAWPVPSAHATFARVFWIGLPLMLLVAAMILPFLWN